MIRSDQWYWRGTLQQAIAEASGSSLRNGGKWTVFRFPDRVTYGRCASRNVEAGCKPVLELWHREIPVASLIGWGFALTVKRLI